MADSNGRNSFLNPEFDDRTSAQDIAMQNMTQSQLREWRSQQAANIGSQTKLSSQHRKYLKEMQAELDSGQRIDKPALVRLMKQAKSKSGISTSELLDFTLGDTKRNRELARTLDAAVLKAYTDNIRDIADKFIGGISPQDVINNSRLEDIKRANLQIHLASLFNRKGSVLKFVTNAGKDSKSKHHYVTVELLNYPTLITGRTKKPNPFEVKEAITDGKIRFDCDCGRHQYWYRYIATVGKYNYGIDERRYPSTRNPRVTGVACKHVLRVMKYVTSPTMLARIGDYAKKDIASANDSLKAHRPSSAALARDIQRQADAANRWNAPQHWSKKIKKMVDEAALQVVKDQRSNAANQSSVRPSQVEISNYQYAKLQLKAAGVPADFKKVFRTKVREYENKWGKS